MSGQQRAHKDITAPLFYRSAACIFLGTVLALLILNLLLLTIGAERLDSLLDNLPSRVLLGALDVTSAFGGIAHWIGMMWNCLTPRKASPGSKIWMVSLNPLHEYARSLDLLLQSLRTRGSRVERSWELIVDENRRSRNFAPFVCQSQGR